MVLFIRNFLIPLAYEISLFSISKAARDVFQKIFAAENESDLKNDPPRLDFCQF